MPKKVLILALHLGYGGVEKTITSLANSLIKNTNYKVEIASIYNLYGNSVYDLNDKVKVTYLIDSDIPLKVSKYKNLLFRFHFLTLMKLLFKDYISKAKFKELFNDSLSILMYSKRSKVIKKLLKETDADVIISTRIFLNELLSLYAKDNVLKIGWEHNHYHNDLKYATDVVRSTKNLDYLVLVSKSLQKFYRKKLASYKCKCIYIPNAIENIPKTKSPLTNNHLISVGRLAPEKGYLDLLKIFNDLKKKKFTWHLDIVGDGNERTKLEKYIKDNNLTNVVTLHGFKNSTEIEHLMKKASIYVMTSYTESFGIVLLEAMSNGLPCLAFDSAEGAKEIITSGLDGYLIKHRNFKVMEKKILDLAKDLDKRKELGKNGRSKVKEYVSDKVVEKWQKIIEKK